jgi:hypothetical protein
VLFGLVLGALVSMPLTGRLIARWGSRTIALPAALAFCATLTLPALAPNYAALIAAAVLYGAVKGAVHVSINAQAITVENAIERPIISSVNGARRGGRGAAPGLAAVLIGFATVGFGIANLVPILFGVAGRPHENGAGPGLATVTTLGYFGFLSGPPVIGALAAFAGLPLAFGMVVVFGTIIASLGVSVVRPSSLKVS